MTHSGKHHGTRGAWAFGARALVSAGAAAVVLAVSSYGAGAMTLQEAIKVAVDSHPNILVQKSAKAQSEQEIKEALARYYPSVDLRAATGFDSFNNNTTRFRRTRTTFPSVAANGTTNFGGPQSDGPSATRMWHNDARVDVSQMLFDGFETPSLVEAARWRTEVNKEQIRDAEENIALRVIEAFLAVLRTREVVDLAMENVQAHVDVTENVRLRLESGAGNQADVLQAESRLANAMDRLLKQKGDLREAQNDFLEAVGVMPDELDLPATPAGDIPVSVDEAVTRALASNPASRAAEIAIDARRADAEAAEGVFMPRFDLEMSAAEENNTNGVRSSSAVYEALAVMRFNLYRGGTDTAKLRRAREFVSETMLRSRETNRLVEEQVRNDWNQLETATTRLPQLEARVLSASQVVSAYRQQFELGQRTLLDVLDVENELFQARVGLVEGEYDVLFAHYLIIHTLGELLPLYGITSQAYAEAVPPQEDPPLLLLGD